MVQVLCPNHWTTRNSLFLLSSLADPPYCFTVAILSTLYQQCRRLLFSTIPLTLVIHVLSDDGHSTEMVLQYVAVQVQTCISLMIVITDMLHVPVGHPYDIHMGKCLFRSSLCLCFNWLVFQTPELYELAPDISIHPLLSAFSFNRNISPIQ